MIYEVLDLQERVWLSVHYEWVDSERVVTYNVNQEKSK